METEATENQTTLNENPTPETPTKEKTKNEDIVVEQEKDGLYYLVHIHNPKDCNIFIKQSGNPDPPVPPYKP